MQDEKTTTDQAPAGGCTNCGAEVTERHPNYGWTCDACVAHEQAAWKASDEETNGGTMPLDISKAHPVAPGSETVRDERFAHRRIATALDESEENGIAVDLIGVDTIQIMSEHTGDGESTASWVTFPAGMTVDLIAALVEAAKVRDRVRSNLADEEDGE